MGFFEKQPQVLRLRNPRNARVTSLRMTPFYLAIRGEKRIPFADDKQEKATTKAAKRFTFPLIAMRPR